MELRYTYDAERFYLGTLCIHGHQWPGTAQSLRMYYVSPSGVRVDRCMGCTGRKQSDWLIRFIDYKASGFEPGRKLGKLCPAGHKWNGQEMSLRSASRPGHCIECESARRQSEDYKKARRDRYASDELFREKQRAAQRVRNVGQWERLTQEQRQARVEYKRQVREARRQQGLNSRGTAPIRSAEEIQARQENKDRLRAAAEARRQERAAKRAMREQDPQWEVKEKERQRQHRLARYQTDESFRIYNREKSKRRKAKLKSVHNVKIKSREIRARNAQFAGCAYCGCDGDMHIEHFLPIAPGGTHTLGNIIPACKRCNFSKTDHDPESWYRRQSFFTEKRWRKILSVLGKSRGPVNQLPLL